MTEKCKCGATFSVYALNTYVCRVIERSGEMRNFSTLTVILGDQAVTGTFIEIPVWVQVKYHYRRKLLLHLPAKSHSWNYHSNVSKGLNVNFRNLLERIQNKWNFLQVCFTSTLTSSEREKNNNIESNKFSIVIFNLDRSQNFIDTFVNVALSAAS